MKMKFVVVCLLLALAACKKDDDRTPVSAIITSVRVTKYPSTNGGNVWDPAFSFPDNQPDIRLEIYKGSAQLLVTQTADNHSAPPIQFAPLSVFIDDVSATYELRLVDVDNLGGNQIMQSFTFTPYTGKIYETGQVKETNLEADIKVSWNF